MSVKSKKTNVTNASGDTSKKTFARIIKEIPTIWPEWNDSKYSSIIWEPFKKGNINENSLYKDVFGCILPISLQSRINKWTRVHELFPEQTIHVAQEFNIAYPDYIELNRHIMDSDIIRLILSAYGILQYIGDNQGIKIEYTGSEFIPNMQSRPWRPWFHIYSCNKSGKNNYTLPTWNNMGLCIVRLFYVGCWRQIEIDDLIPVDIENRPLLPMIKANNDNEVVLWPLLLTKALLKVAALSWDTVNEIFDFSPIYCLTGWPSQKINVKELTRLDVWELCIPYVEKYVWPEDSEEAEKLSKRIASPKSRPTSKKAKNMRSSVSYRQNSAMPFYLCGTIKDTSALKLMDIPNITPSYGHQFLILETRDIPLEKPNDPPELESWKQHRWIEWAREKGLYPLSSKDIHINFFKMFTLFRESLIIEENIVEAKEISISEKENKKKKVKDAKSSLHKLKETSELQEKKSSVIWGDFNLIFPQLESIEIFFIPSQFNFKKTVSNIYDENSEIKKSTGDISECIYWPNQLLISRNKPLYLCVDTINPQFILFSFEHQNIRLPTMSQFDEIKEKMALEKRNLEKLTEKENDDECKSQISVTVSNKKHVEELDLNVLYNTRRSKAHFLMEDLDINKISLGVIEYFIITTGIGSHCISFPDGRYIFRLWLKSETTYYLRIYSDLPLVVGEFKDIAMVLNEESQRMQIFCNRFSNNFSLFFDSMGLEEFCTNMQNFYKVFKPDLREYDKNLSTQLNDQIVVEMIKLIPKDLKSVEVFKNILYSLQVLFGQNFKEPYSRFDLNELTKIKDRCHVRNIKKAIKLQSFFKRIFVKQLLSHRQLTDKKFKIIYDSLKQFYDANFNTETRFNVIPYLIRNLFTSCNIQNPEEWYSFAKDFKYTWTVYTFGINAKDMKMLCKPFEWIPIVIFIFYCQTDLKVLVTFELSCNLPIYILRVFNNDTGIEIPRTSNNVNPTYYEKNQKGYTVIAYGKNGADTLENFYWNLNIVHKKTEVPYPLKCDFHQLIQKRLFDYYIPNVNNIVGKFIVKIEYSMMLAFQIAISYELAKVLVTCIAENGEVIAYIIGSKCIVLPVFLEAKEIEKSETEVLPATNTKLKTSKIKSASDTVSTLVNETAYYIEITVLDDSWPLTEEEWENVAIQKKKYLFENLKNVKSGKANGKKGSIKMQVGGKKSGQMDVNDGTLKQPFYSIIAFSYNDFNFIKDTRREEEIVQMKKEWEEKEPGRAKRAKQIRESYLNSHYLPVIEEEKVQEEENKLSNMEDKEKFITKHDKFLNVTQQIHGKRTFKPKIPPTNILPPFNIAMYEAPLELYREMKQLLLEQYKNLLTTDLQWIKTPSEIDLHARMRQLERECFEWHQELFKKKTINWMIDYDCRFQTVFDKFQRDRMESERLTDKAYEVRRECINSTKMDLVQKRSSNLDLKSTNRNK